MGLVALVMGAAPLVYGEPETAGKPNILFILADDLGYGDLGCYGATQVKTPHIDRLAREGRRFTDAHSPCSVCTPTRYNVLTGRYCWRTWAGTSCVWSTDPLLIDTDRLTLPKLLKRHGYTTACIGKWHLGFGRPGEKGWDEVYGPDYNLPLKPGPLEVGFDYFFGIPHVGQLPHVYIRNHSIVGRSPEDRITLVLDKNKGFRLPYTERPRIGTTPWHTFEGTKNFTYAHEDLALRLTEEAVDWLEQRRDDKPFFLYLAHRNVHGPVTPNKRFRGTSGIGAYGDFIHELDWSVGQVLDTLDRLELSGNTIVFFSSDNGAVSRGYRPVDFVKYGTHRANGLWRGQKTEIYEGGHRVPLLVRWPGHVTAGSTSSQLVALTDMLATAAELLGDTLPAGAGEDSFSFLPALRDRPACGPVRHTIVNDSYTGEMAIREGAWKLIQAPHGGGIGKLKGKHASDLPPVQLFNLEKDPTESENLYATHPDTVARLERILTRLRESGRSRPVARLNPYLNTVLDHLRAVDAAPRLPEKLDSCWTFRALAEQALNAAWAASWDGSPRRGNPTLIDRARGLISYCLKQQKGGTWFHSRSWNAGDPNCDRFALGPLMDAIWWLRRLPGMDADWRQWEGVLKEVVDFQYANWGCYRERGLKNNIAWGAFAYVYPNQDVFYLYVMELAARWWKEEKYREAVTKTLDAIESQLLPDGGLRYIGPETECPVYHNVNLVWLARYLLLTGSERVRKLITSTLPYYPLTFSNEGFPESYTDCWWKHTWNDGSPTGPAIMAGITGDPQHAWLAQHLLERRGARPNYWTIVAGMTYRTGIVPQPLPDNWLRLDRNVGGPRGRFGTWYFAGVTGGGARDTFAGAMICEPDREQPLNGAFLAANIEVATGGEGPRDRTHLYLSGPDDVTDVVMAKNGAALGVVYTLRKPYINSSMTPNVPPSPWPATQVWLFTPQALVGLVEVTTTKKQTVAGINGELRFGPNAPLTRDAEGMFHCGALRIELLGHTFDKVNHGRARPGYNRKSTRQSAVLLSVEGDAVTVMPDMRRWYAAAIAPETAPQITRFRRNEKNDHLGFTVMVGDARYGVTFDPHRGRVALLGAR